MIKIVSYDDRPIVILGGGGGPMRMVELFKEDGRFDPKKFTTIHPVSDSGGSTAHFRKQGFVSIGDMRRSIAAQADPILLRTPFGREFLRRYSLNHSEWPGMSGGNRIIADTARKYGGPKRHEAMIDALAEVSQRLGVQGKVLPVSLESADLCGLPVNDVYDPVTHRPSPHPYRLTHEAQFDEWPLHADPIASSHLSKDIHICDEVAHALYEQRGKPPLIIWPFGSFFGSTMAIAHVGGMADAMHLAVERGAKIVMITRIMNKLNETGHWTSADYVERLFAQLELDTIHAVICYDHRQYPGAIPRRVLDRYKEEREELVEYKKSPIALRNIRGPFASINKKGHIVHNKEVINVLFNL